MTASLWPWSVFAAMIAAAGLPVYIHAPKFFVDRHGVSLAALGAVLALLRAADVVLDPWLGWLADAARGRRGLLVAAATTLLALALIGLFATLPPIAPLLWFALVMAALFTAYSFLTIAFYAQGVARAESGSGAQRLGHLRLAAWRESGALAGVCAAAAAPALLALTPIDPFTGFAVGFAALAALALWSMRGNWAGEARGTAPLRPAFRSAFRPVLQDAQARRLLLIALLNGAPVAVSSTLFLFFVDSQLAAPATAGPLLLLFFLAAAASVPLWSRIAARIGLRPSLQLGMALSILAFGCTLALAPGQIGAFALICLASGAALGADATLLPALFSRHLARLGSSEGMGFGLWAFMSKLSMALAAATLLPLLQLSGYQPSGPNPAQALQTLTLLYGLLPCLLKLAALALLSLSDLSETSQ